MPTLRTYDRKDFDSHVESLLLDAPGICFCNIPITRIMGGEHGLEAKQVDHKLRADWLVCCRYGYEGRAILMVGGDGRELVPLFATLEAGSKPANETEDSQRKNEEPSP